MKISKEILQLQLFQATMAPMPRFFGRILALGWVLIMLAAPTLASQEAHEGGEAQRIVIFVVLLMSVSTAVALLTKVIPIPFTVALFVLGILLALSIEIFPEIKFLKAYQLHPDIILNVFLPILLFEAAFNLDSRRLIKNLVPILSLAVPALLISTFAVAILISFFVPALPFSVALLFGALISATDPVAVVALFKEMGAPKRLTILVEGESLFNDGTALVVFGIILHTLSLTPGEGEGISMIIAKGVFTLVRVCGVGLAAGLLFGWLASVLLPKLHADALLEVTVTAVLAPFTFIFSEHVLHASGVIACVAAALVIGNFGRTKFSHKGLEQIHGYWEYMAFVANSLIFLMVGLSIDLRLLAQKWPILLLTIVSVLAARAFAVFLVVPLANRMVPTLDIINKKIQTILWWGGLRGALALAMALSIPDHFSVGGIEFKDDIIIMTVAVVFFTLMISASTIGPVMGWLGLKQYSPIERFERQEGLILAHKAALGELSHLKTQRLPAKVLNDLRKEYRNSGKKLDAELKKIRFKDKIKGKWEVALVLRHALSIEKTHVSALFEEGEIDDITMKDLHLQIENMQDLAKQNPDQGSVTDEQNLQALLTGQAHSLVQTIPGFTQLFGWAITFYRFRRLVRLYEKAMGELLALSATRKDMSKYARTGVASKSSYKAVESMYKLREEEAERRLRFLNEQFPEYSLKMQRYVAQRSCIKRELESFQELYAKGLVPEKAMKEIQIDTARRLGSLSPADVSDFLVSPKQILKKVPLFKGLSQKALDQLNELLWSQSYLDGEAVVREHQPGDSMYLIGRGAVKITRDDHGHEVELAVLSAGGFFGEIALLTEGKRTATVTTLTPCTVLKLKKKDFASLLSNNPDLNRRVRAVAAQRLKA